MSTTGDESEVLRHPLIRRLTHWLFMVAVLIMIGSGWRIYNDVPILPFRFPLWATLGGDPNYSYELHGESGTANALLWDFAGMWLLAASLAIYALHGLLTDHFRGAFLPVASRAFLADFIAAACFRLEHRLGSYNMVQVPKTLLAMTLGKATVHPHPHAPQPGE